MSSGRYKYVPKDLLDEADRVRQDFNISADADVFRKIAENSRIARQIRFTIDINVRRRK